MCKLSELACMCSPVAYFKLDQQEDQAFSVVHVCMSAACICMGASKGAVLNVLINVVAMPVLSFPEPMLTFPICALLLLVGLMSGEKQQPSF